MIGLPRSGKSTTCKNIYIPKGFPIVSPDSIRMSLYHDRFIPSMENYVWAITYNMIESLFISGHNVVVLDSTNIIEKLRNEIVKEFGLEYKIEWDIISTSKQECIQRALDNKDYYIIPVIDKMFKVCDVKEIIDSTNLDPRVIEYEQYLKVIPDSIETEVG
jgi:predicted kinase